MVVVVVVVGFKPRVFCLLGKCSTPELSKPLNVFLRKCTQRETPEEYVGITITLNVDDKITPIMSTANAV